MSQMFGGVGRPPTYGTGRMLGGSGHAQYGAGSAYGSGEGTVSEGRRTTNPEVITGEFIGTAESS
ncbi:hypothetical protein B0A48_01822 [Cryoendolithus antarcticus]|uniref:Uncharacterized protein n=1 Tax=Cryoendolithus antarcticus TaxID=1507870 RepID=A0A1V8TQD0_9PEZI|nr:hypothetical protein B0A48_01822 [Cryoendolithus antarcticus]